MKKVPKEGLLKLAKWSRSQEALLCYVLLLSTHLDYVLLPLCPVIRYFCFCQLFCLIDSYTRFTYASKPKKDIPWLRLYIHGYSFKLSTFSFRVLLDTGDLESTLTSMRTPSEYVQAGM